MSVEHQAEYWPTKIGSQASQGMTTPTLDFARQGGR